MFNYEIVNIMKINVIRIAMLVFAATLMVSCKNATRNGSYLKDYKFEVQSDGSVNYTIEGGADKRMRMVYLIPNFNRRQIIDSAAIWPISGTFKLEGTVPRQGIYSIITDTTVRGYSIANVKLYNDSFSAVSEKDYPGDIGRVEIEGAPSGVVYIYHVSDTVNPVYAYTAYMGTCSIFRNFLAVHGDYYSIRYKSEGRLIYAADSIYLCDSLAARLYGKYKGN